MQTTRMQIGCLDFGERKREQNELKKKGRTKLDLVFL